MSTRADPRRGLRALVLLLVGLAAAFLAAGHARNPLIEQAGDYASSIAATAAGTYVTLRTLNAFLSTVQEVEVSGNVVFAGGSAQPMKVLEPIDDTVERIAGVIFVVLVTTGLLSIAMVPLGSVGFAMLALAALIWLADLFLGRRDIAMLLARRLASYGGFLALAVPLAFLVSALVADRMTDEVWARHQAVVAEITASVTPDAEAEEPGNWVREAVADADRYRTLSANLYDRADDLIASYVAILSVFLFKVFVLPTMLLGALFVIARFFARASGSSG